MDRKLVVLIGLTLLILQNAAAQERSPIVNRIDHVMTLLPDIAAVDRMQALFADTLGLPPWCEPALRRDANRPTWAFYNTGVYVGGAFLEFLTFNVDEATTAERSAEFSGFAFESGVPSIAEHLDERDVAHGRDVVMAMEDGAGGIDTLVTNIRLSELSRSGTTIFFSHNHPELFDNPGFRFTRLPPMRTNAEHHAHFRQLLEESGGGVLGALRASEVVVSVPAAEDVRSTVSALMDPLREIEPGVWVLPEGPALRLEPGDDYGVARVTLTVHSLKKAVEALKQFDLLGMDVPGYAVLDQERLWGIQIWLVEQDAASGTADAR